MHNKSLTVDNQITLIGGRNMGDAYFGATDGVVFADMDVLAVGPAVDEVSTDCGLYWAAVSSYPAERLLPETAPDALAALAERVARSTEGPAASDCITALKASAFALQLLAGELPLVWASTRMVSDPPSKVMADKDTRRTLASSLAGVMGQTTQELQIVSPYFVPTQAVCGSVGGVAPAGRAGVGADEFAGGDRCERGPCRLRQTPASAAARRCAAL